jgi:hypothetical protein
MLKPLWLNHMPVLNNLPDALDLVVGQKPTKPRRHRRRAFDKLIKQAEKTTGKIVTSITTPEGYTLRFEELEDNTPDNVLDNWIAARKCAFD